uniref:Uncharacterized protein n=1 Tax=Candida prachuapensis TaxID=536035 RepID=U3MH93_9ASCO|nr:hypothetical protein [Candida prachuapensis]AGW07371.1 hypothetical protein [Candida prachuapensis]
MKKTMNFYNNMDMANLFKQTDTYTDTERYNVRKDMSNIDGPAADSGGPCISHIGADNATPLSNKNRTMEGLKMLDKQTNNDMTYPMSIITNKETINTTNSNLSMSCTIDPTTSLITPGRTMGPIKMSNDMMKEKSMPMASVALNNDNYDNGPNMPYKLSKKYEGKMMLIYLPNNDKPLCRVRGMGRLAKTFSMSKTTLTKALKKGYIYMPKEFMMYLNDMALKNDTPLSDRIINMDKSKYKYKATMKAMPSYQLIKLEMMSTRMARTRRAC